MSSTTIDNSNQCFKSAVSPIPNVVNNDAVQPNTSTVFAIYAYYENV